MQCYAWRQVGTRHIGGTALEVLEMSNHYAMRLKVI